MAFGPTTPSSTKPSCLECHSKLSFEIFFSIAGFVCCLSAFWRIANTHFLNALLWPSIPMSLPHMWTTLNFFYGQYSVVCHPDTWILQEQPMSTFFAHFTVIFALPFFTKSYTIFFCNEVVDQCQPHFFRIVKLLASTTNTIISPSRDTDGVIHHIFWQPHLLTVNDTNSIRTGPNTFWDSCVPNNKRLQDKQNNI